MNKKTVLGALVGAAVLLGSLGTGAAVTASAAGENIYAEDSRVYTEEQFITYEAGATYELDVCLSSTVGIASFQMDFHMPDYTEIVEVRETLGDTLYDVYSEGNKQNFVISGTSGVNKTEGVLFTVVYTLTAESGDATPVADIHKLTTIDHETLTAKEVTGFGVEFGVIHVEKEDVITRLMGDMDEDGDIDLEDVLIVQRSLINPNFSLTAGQTQYADINGDGVIDLLDCQYMQMYIVGLLNSLENVGGNGGGNDNGNQGGNENGGGDVTDPGEGEEQNKMQVKVQLRVDGQMTWQNNVMDVSEGTTAAMLMDAYKFYNGKEYVVTVYSDGNYSKVVSASTVLRAITYYLSLESTTTNPVEPGELVVSYTLVADGDVMGDYTLAFSAGDTVVKFMETYKVYDGVAYSEIFVYACTEDGATVMLTSDTLLETGAHYRVVLTGGTHLGGDETNEKINVFVQRTVDGLAYREESKQFNKGDTVLALRDAFMQEGYTIRVFTDEQHTMEMTEEEMEAILLGEGNRYYIWLTSMESVDPVEPILSEAFVTLVVDGVSEEHTYAFTMGATVADLQNYYKGYNGTSYDLVIVYGYAADGMMAQLSSADLLIANGRYRVELNYTIKEDIVTPVVPTEGAYTNVENLNQILVFSETNGNMFTIAEIKDDAGNYVIIDMCSYEIMEQYEDGNMVLKVSSIIENTTYVIEVYTVDLTFRIK